MKPFPYNIEYETRRMRQLHRFKREISLMCVIAGFALVCVAMGALTAAAESLCEILLAWLVFLAGLRGAHYLLTHH